MLQLAVPLNQSLPSAGLCPIPAGHYRLGTKIWDMAQSLEHVDFMLQFTEVDLVTLGPWININPHTVQIERVAAAAIWAAESVQTEIRIWAPVKFNSPSVASVSSTAEQKCSRHRTRLEHNAVKPLSHL